MAKSRSIGGIYASLSLRDGGFKRGLSSAKKQLMEFGGTAIKSAAIGAAGLGAAMATAAVMGTRSTLSMVDDLGDVSAQTGIAISDMMRLQRAYADGGREASNVGKDVGKMQKALVEASSGGSDPFSSIGLSAKELLKLDPAQQFQQIGEAIMRIQNPAERTAKAMEIFGKGGMGLVTVFGGIDGAVTSLGKMPELAQKFGAAMGEANDLIGHLPVKSDQFFVGFTSGIIGQLLPALQKIDNYDFTDLGMSVGTALATAFEMITDGSMWEIFQLNAEKAILSIQKSDAMNGWAATINTIFDGITNNMGEGGFNFTESFDKYSQAGKDTNNDLITEKESRIAEIMNQAADNFAQKQQDAADKSAKPVIDKPIISTITQEVATAKQVDTRQASMEVNEYQRRGLSLGGNADTKKIDTQIQLTTEMRDILKKMANRTNELTWT